MKASTRFKIDLAAGLLVGVALWVAWGAVVSLVHTYFYTAFLQGGGAAFMIMGAWALHLIGRARW